MSICYLNVETTTFFITLPSPMKLNVLILFQKSGMARNKIQSESLLQNWQK